MKARHETRKALSPTETNLLYTFGSISMTHTCMLFKTLLGLAASRSFESGLPDLVSTVPLELTLCDLRTRQRYKLAGSAKMRQVDH